MLRSIWSRVRDASWTKTPSAHGCDETLMSVEFVRRELLYLLLHLPLWWLAVWPWVGGDLFFVRGDTGESHGRAWYGAAAMVSAVPQLLRSGAMACLVVALAHPRTG